MKEIILASASIRRKELLEKITKKFKIIPSNIDEIYPPNLDLFSVPLYISNMKALDIYKDHPDSIVIGCDTAIVFNNTLIGKPKSKDNAKNMLLRFSGNYHYVITGATIYVNNQKYEINSINKVHFKSITEQEIDEYLTYDEYKDKAGAYAIQGIAAKFIEKFEGEYDAIVGLPSKDIKSILKNLI